ncbi:MAG TPA: FkbM family methyltransferase [Nonomuraea sp.]|nr:FkbM family methyltransferase [Nonomuraea sp.]
MQARGGAKARAALRRLRSATWVNRAVVPGLRATSTTLAELSAYLELHGIHQGHVEVSLPSGELLRLWADKEDVLANMLWWRGWDGYETASTRTWVSLAMNARLVIDVGANAGVFALLAAASNPGANVIAFEPNPASFSLLTRNVALNPRARVTCVNAAVTEVEGTVTLYADAGEPFDLRASIVPGARPDAPASGVRQEECAAINLDAYLQREGVAHVDLVKIDVEGAEPLVLAGMKQVLARDRPDILVEILNTDVAQAVGTVVAEHGYSHFLMTSDGPVATETVAPHPRCLNHLLTTRPVSEVQRLG